MAMNIHQEARRRQMHMDRVCEARRKNVSTYDDVQASGAAVNSNIGSDSLMCTDQGQFYQTRASWQRDSVVFEKVIHDPNFHYRSAVERGAKPPLHVNAIYKVMYPGAYVEVPARSVHVWTGPERNRRTYDRSREGPVLGQSWQALEREMKFRENSLSAAHYNMPAVRLGGFQPVDVAFPRK